MNIVLFSRSDIRTSLHATTGDIQIDKMVQCERGLLSAVTVLLVMAEVGHSLDVKMELAFVVYLINPRCACAVRVTVVVLSFRPSVCYHVFCHYAQEDGQ